MSAALPLFTPVFTGMGCCPDRTLTGACFAEDGRHRYALWRRWAEGPLVGMIGANPSVANAQVLDNTLTRFLDFSQAWKFSGMEVCNIFPYVSTDPKGLATCDDRDGDADGACNDAHIASLLQRVPLVIVAWGDIPNKKRYRYAIERFNRIVERLRAQGQTIADIQCFGTTKSGMPKHPLYLAKTTTLTSWSPT